MREIYIEDLFQSPALHATLTSVCETRAEFFPMMGILCIDGGVFPVNTGAAVTKLTWHFAPAKEKNFNVTTNLRLNLEIQNTQARIRRNNREQPKSLAESFQLFRGIIF